MSFTIYGLWEGGKEVGIPLADYYDVCCIYILCWCMQLTVFGLDKAGTFAILSQKPDWLMVYARLGNLYWFEIVNSTQPLRVTAVGQCLEPNKTCRKSYQESAASFVQRLGKSQQIRYAKYLKDFVYLAIGLSPTRAEAVFKLRFTRLESSCSRCGFTSHRCSIYVAQAIQRLS